MNRTTAGTLLAAVLLPLTVLSHPAHAVDIPDYGQVTDLVAVDPAVNIGIEANGGGGRFRFILHLNGLTDSALVPDRDCTLFIDGAPWGPPGYPCRLWTAVVATGSGDYALRTSEGASVVSFHYTLPAAADLTLRCAIVTARLGKSMTGVVAGKPVPGHRIRLVTTGTCERGPRQGFWYSAPEFGGWQHARRLVVDKRGTGFLAPGRAHHVTVTIAYFSPSGAIESAGQVRIP